jgi:hypothetical protein
MGERRGHTEFSAEASPSSPTPSRSVLASGEKKSRLDPSHSARLGPGSRLSGDVTKTRRSHMRCGGACRLPGPLCWSAPHALRARSHADGRVGRGRGHCGRCRSTARSCSTSGARPTPPTRSPPPPSLRPAPMVCCFRPAPLLALPPSSPCPKAPRRMHGPSAS